MTWVLLVEVLLVTTCQPGWRFCPPTRPPVVSQMPQANEAACRARASQYRQAFPPTRLLLHTDQMRMEQVTTVRCVSQAQR